MPVHRIPGASKGRVFAYESELRQWLTTAEAEPVSRAQELLREAQTQHTPEADEKPGARRIGRWVAALALGLCVITAVFANRIVHRFAVHASATGAPAAGTPDFRKPHTSDAEEYYLKGRYYWNKRTPDDLNRAVDYFTQAIVRDPSYCKAYVGLADSYNLLREYSAMPPEEAYPRAFAAAAKAVELDDSSAEAHTSLAFVTFFWRWDGAGAEREFKRALTLNPNDARAHHWYASFLQASGRFQEALAQIEAAQRLDPSSVAILADKGHFLGFVDQVAAVALLRQIEVAEPSFASPHRYLAEIFRDRKDYAAYLSEWKKTANLLRDQQELSLEQAAEQGFAKGGYKGMLESLLQLQLTLNQRGLVPAFSVAQTYGCLGRKQDALQYLKIAYEKHDSSLLILSIDAPFSSLHDDPEYKALVARINPSAQPATSSPQDRF